MDAFEIIAARFFEVQGFWTRIGVKVEITKGEKVTLNNASMPRPEIDVVAWKASTNQLLIIECKSYLDSTGVRIEHLHGQEHVDNDKFKLFNRAGLRALVVTALIRQLRAEGLIIGPDPSAQFVLVAGKIYSDHEGESEKPLRGVRLAPDRSRRARARRPAFREARLRERRNHHRDETARAKPRQVALGEAARVPANELQTKNQEPRTKNQELRTKN